MTRRSLILVLAAGLLAAQGNDPGVMLQQGIRKETVEGDLKGAIEIYKRVAASKNRSAAATALLRLGECYEKQGDAEARRSYERLVREFGDQQDQAREAQARLTVLGRTAAGSGTLSARQILKGDFPPSRITPDGKFLVSLGFGGSKNLGVRNLETGEVKGLTTGGISGGGFHGFPIPSRDSKRIAYMWHMGGINWELRTINLDGSAVHTVAKFTGTWFYPADWSPDGKLVVGFRIDSTPDRRWAGISTFETATGVEHRHGSLAPNASAVDIAGFSPDGKWVVYSKTNALRDWNIFAIHTQTGQETTVVDGAGTDRQPMWVPGSDRIVFSSDRKGQNAVWMVRFQDGRAAGSPVLLKADAGDYLAMGISRDGSLFYRLRHTVKDIYQATVDPGSLQVKDAPARAVESFRGSNAKPVWSPSGDTFAYFSDRGDVKSGARTPNGNPSERLVVRRRDGKETVIAEPLQTTFSMPHWCSDGKILAKGTPKWLGEKIFDAKTGEPLADVGAASSRDLGQIQHAYSPDCRTAYVSSYWPQGNKRTILRLDIATGAWTELWSDTAAQWAPGLYVSPDGRWLALHGNIANGKGYGILLIPTAGGTLRMLDEFATNLDGTAFFYGLTWTPDSKRLMYPRPVGKGPDNELYWIPVEGGAAKSMGIRMPVATAPSLNADGKILFSTEETTNELWALRNLPLN